MSDAIRTDIQKEAIRRMIQMQNEYGIVFLEKSLHKARFEYAALKRVAAGLDTALSSTDRVVPPAMRSSEAE